MRRPESSRASASRGCVDVITITIIVHNNSTPQQQWRCHPYFYPTVPVCGTLIALFFIFGAFTGRPTCHYLVLSAQLLFRPRRQCSSGRSLFHGPFIHTYIHTYIPSYIHTYKHSLARSSECSTHTVSQVDACATRPRPVPHERICAAATRRPPAHPSHPGGRRRRFDFLRRGRDRWGRDRWRR